MSNFKVGEMLAYYTGNMRFVLKLSRIDDDGILHFYAEHNPGYVNSMAHPKQCRRLVKKPRRRVWAQLNSDGIYSNLGELLVNGCIQNGERIEFIEVRKKK